MVITLCTLSLFQYIERPFWGNWKPEGAERSSAPFRSHSVVWNDGEWNYRSLFFRGWQWSNNYSKWAAVPQLGNRLPRVNEMNVANLYFQKDGATCHTLRPNMEILRQKLPGRLISRYGDVEWPARSPDLSPLKFFLVGIS